MLFLEHNIVTHHDYITEKGFAKQRKPKRMQ